MLFWINFLHLYQPPNQDPLILEKVVEESYKHIINLFKKYPECKATINISGSLLEQLNTEKYAYILKEIKNLVGEGRIELVGSAMYHPILSLLSKEEIQRQIRLNNEICQKVFGSLYAPSGFYIPEMAYSPSVGKAVKEAGFTWILLDERHYGDRVPDTKVKYKIKGADLFVLFRNRIFSKTFPPESIIKNFSEIKEPYLITAHDGELYGHWHKDIEGFYEKVFTHREIKLLTVTEYLTILKTVKSIVPKKTNWEGTTKDMAEGIHFALWNHPENRIHKLLWKLARGAIELVEAHKENANYSYARRHLDRGLSSCSWWWAAEAKPDVFSPITWNPDVIESGLRELIKSIRSLKGIDKAQKIVAEKLYAKLLLLIWTNHWEKYN